MTYRPTIVNVLVIHARHGLEYQLTNFLTAPFMAQADNLTVARPTAADCIITFTSDGRPPIEEYRSMVEVWQHKLSIDFQAYGPGWQTKTVLALLPFNEGEDRDNHDPQYGTNLPCHAEDRPHHHCPTCDDGVIYLDPSIA